MNRMVFDSSSIISISDKCFINLLKKMGSMENVEFIIPQEVYNETVSVPMGIKRFELNAIRINDAIDQGYFTIAKPSSEINKTVEKISALVNCIAFSGKKCLKLVHHGELETLALCKEIGASALVIDERTTRLLVEDPEGLKGFLQQRYQKEIEIVGEKISELKKFLGELEIIRSVELIALAYDMGLFEGELSTNKKSLEAALYSMKFAGCAVSFEEIKQFLGERK
ncbi:MAG: hypothetical protein ABID38_02820 [Candidatus Diapherotrites archaeon]